MKTKHTTKKSLKINNTFKKVHPFKNQFRNLKRGNKNTPNIIHIRKVQLNQSEKRTIQTLIKTNQLIICQGSHIRKKNKFSKTQEGVATSMEEEGITITRVTLPSI